MANGKCLDSLLSAWELLGPLLVVCAAPDKVRNKQVEVMVDNEGSVRMFAKGWTTKCQLCNTIMVAINEIAVALNPDVFVTKIRRCSNEQAKNADALSKLDLKSFREMMPMANPGPQKWVADSQPDRFLRLKILTEMSRNTKLLGFNI